VLNWLVLWLSSPAGVAGLLPSLPSLPSTGRHLPNGQDAAGLSEVALLLDATDPLLENGRHLSWRCLRVGGVCAGLEGGNAGCGISLHDTLVSLAETPGSAKT